MTRIFDDPAELEGFSPSRIESAAEDAKAKINTGLTRRIAQSARARPGTRPEIQ